LSEKREDDMTAVMEQAVQTKTHPAAAPAHDATVYCPICTHTVPARVGYVRTASGRKLPRVIAGQRCPRCSSTLDAAYVMRINRTAA
jgi:hypothetical protein